MSISTAVIVAAGKGKRMGTEISKQFLPLCGKEILAHTVEKFEQAACIRDIILVTGGDALQDVRQMAQEYGWKKIISVTEGGKERQDSVFLGLQQVPQDTEIVLIHDGVRPFVSYDTIKQNIESVQKYGSAITCTACYETILLSKSGEKVDSVPYRKDTFAAQAPQSFRLKDIIAAHDEVRAINPSYENMVDACTIMTTLGKEVHMISGNRGNIKVTTPEDVYMFRALLNYKENEQTFGIGLTNGIR